MKRRILLAACLSSACGGGESLGSAPSTPLVTQSLVGGLPAASERNHSPAPLVFDFDHDEPGSLPAGWQIAGTNQTGPVASWAVVRDPDAPSIPNTFALTASAHGSQETFNLCWTDGVRFGDGELELAFRADGGAADQGGGPIWRVRDANNSYVARVNPLESNFRLYCVERGERTQLATADVSIEPGTWHTIRVEHRGAHIACALDGDELLTATDEHLKEAGGLGLWTKADSTTSFDDFQVLGER